ncbi:MAG: DUF1330 domain-containing protein [Alphaproteobacteria bacterium]|nr:DUF1330 domain-containing protein [Alphaproteobacteria bacterium]
MTKFVDPTRGQFGQMMKLPDDGAIHMLNMLRFRKKARYPDGHAAAGEELSGVDAYKRYGEESGPIFRRVGGEVILSWSPKLTLIGPEDEEWHAIFIAQYPNAAAFAEMIKDPAYQKAVVHRQAAVKTSRLIRMAPRSVGPGFAD